jgi:hypothetical protein
LRCVRLVLAVVVATVARFAAVSGPVMAGIDFNDGSFNDNGDFTLSGGGIVVLSSDVFDFINFGGNLLDEGVIQSIGNSSESDNVSLYSFVGAGLSNPAPTTAKHERRRVGVCYPDPSSIFSGIL